MLTTSTESAPSSSCAKLSSAMVMKSFDVMEVSMLAVCDRLHRAVATCFEYGSNDPYLKVPVP